MFMFNILLIKFPFLSYNIIFLFMSVTFQIRAATTIYLQLNKDLIQPSLHITKPRTDKHSASDGNCFSPSLNCICDSVHCNPLTQSITVSSGFSYHTNCILSMKDDTESFLAVNEKKGDECWSLLLKKASVIVFTANPLTQSSTVSSGFNCHSIVFIKER
jgi:hypothetical protein